MDLSQIYLKEEKVCQKSYSKHGKAVLSEPPLIHSDKQFTCKWIHMPYREAKAPWSRRSACTPSPHPPPPFLFFPPFQSFFFFPVLDMYSKLFS